jgi:Flp pilus assembly protein TadG
VLDVAKRHHGLSSRFFKSRSEFLRFFRRGGVFCPTFPHSAVKAASNTTAVSGTPVMKLWRSHPRRASTGRNGATSVEVALTLPIFGILLAGLLEFSHYFMVVHMLNAAARQGALLGSYQGVTNAQVTSKVQSIISTAFNSTQATISINDGATFDSANVNAGTLNYSTLPSANLSNSATGSCFLVQVSVPYDKVALLPPWWIKGATVKGRAVMRHE